MITKENIKDYIENSETDILFEKFISLLPNDNKIIYEPRGLFNKGILNDTGRVTKKKGNLFLEVNRPGFYDILPKGLFHNKLDDHNNQPQFIEQVENEKKTFRNLFLPFDSEIFSTIAKIEKEGNNHFKYSFDSEITISMLIFFRIFDEMDLISLFEILFIDCIEFKRNETEEFNFQNFIDSLFKPNISAYKLMVNLLENSQGESRIKRFLNTVPSAPIEAGKIKSTEKILEYIFREKIRISKIKKNKKYYSKERNNRIGNNSLLNTDSKSLLLGNFFTDEPEYYEIRIEIKPENIILLSKFKEGCLHQFLKSILSFFLTFETEYKITIQTLNEIDKLKEGTSFSLQPDTDKKFNRIALIRTENLNEFKKISPYNSSFFSGLHDELKFQLRDYFYLFYTEIFCNTSDYTLLNINSKI